MIPYIGWNSIPNIEKELNTITWTAGYTQIIDKPTHFINHSSYCIDLIFTSNPSIIVNSGIDKSFCSSYHLDIIYRKINFRFPLSLPCLRTIWNYKNAGAGFLQSDIENFNCQYAFESGTNNTVYFSFITAKQSTENHEILYLPRRY